MTTNKVTCIIVDDEPVARGILESYIDKVGNIEVLKSCKNVVEAFDVINNNQVDLVFLDINMPEVSGLTLAKALGKKTKVIFTTAYREYAIDGFDLQAVDYLLKPISFERFLKAVHNFFDISSQKVTSSDSVAKKNENHFIFVRSERKMVKVDFGEILYVESLSDYIKIHTNNKTIVTRETITNIEAKLPKSQFLRIHRSYIASIKNIESYTNEFVEIKNKALPISRSYKESILEKLEKI
jgi:DNA-binding LytR/AlgR family response regulator